MRVVSLLLASPSSPLHTAQPVMLRWMGSLQNKIIIREETWSNFQTTSLENEFEANRTQITLEKRKIKWEK